MLFGWPWNALIVLGVFIAVDALFVFAAWRLENRYVQPPTDPRLLEERQFADDVEAYVRES